MSAKSYNNYMAKVMDLKQIIKELEELSKLDKIEFYLSGYQVEINDIINEVEKLEKRGEKNIPYDMYTNSLDLIKQKINKGFSALYHIRLHVYKINNLLKNVSEDNISTIHRETVDLLYFINNLTTIDEETKKVLNEAYKTIYNVILNEAAIDNYTILGQSSITRDDSIRENLSVLVNKDLKELSQEEVIDIKINKNSKDLGYDNLDRDTIKKIAMAKLGNKYDKYLERKKSVSQHFLEEIDKLNKEKEDIETQKEEDKTNIKNLRICVSKARLKLMALILVPVIGMGGLAYLGTLALRRHRTTTKTYNAINNETIDEDKVVYGYTDYVYKANIKKCSPWREKLTGDGYVRDVLEFEYKDKTVADRIDVDQALRMVEEKKETVEHKAELEEGDSLIEPETIVIETIVDKEDTVANPATVIAFPIVGALLVALLDCAVHDFCGNWYFDKFGDVLEDLIDDKKSLRSSIKGKLTRKVIKEKFVKIGKDVVKLQEDYKDAVSKYGEMEKVLTPELLETAKKYAMKR